MHMRENFVKEREILQAYEDMRNQQKTEIQSLMAVSKHLGTMAFSATGNDTMRRASADPNDIIQKMLNP